MITDRLLERIKRFEGFSNKPYTDTVGKKTIGYGRNLEANPLSLEEVLSLFQKINWLSPDKAEEWSEELLRNDLDNVTKEIVSNIIAFPALDVNQKTVLIDMAYNVGMPSLMKFKKMLGHLTANNPQMAALELLDSRYAEQVKTRAVENALALWPELEDLSKGLMEKNRDRWNVLKPYFDMYNMHY